MRKVRSTDTAIQRVQALIRKKFGQERILAETNRLCGACELRDNFNGPGFACGLYPICLDGSPCPYFRQKEEVQP